MNLSTQIAKHFRDVHFGGNWTSVNLKDTLNGVTWQQATTKVDDLKTIAALLFHINYYIAGVLKVLQGGPLDIRDKFSFGLPPITSEEDWQTWLNKTWTDAESLAVLIETLPEKKLEETFVDEKYGTYYRNLHGLIEHTHYHLGQIVLMKKLLSQPVAQFINGSSFNSVKPPLVFSQPIVASPFVITINFTGTETL